MTATSPRDAILTSRHAIEAAIRNARVNYGQSLKEVGRHVLLKSGAISVLDRRRAAKGFKSASLIERDAAQTFRNNYIYGGWVHECSQESLSGVGSSVHATKGLLAKIESAMVALECKSIVDVGCGDWNWMGRDAFSFDYVGIDVVPEVISANQRYARLNVRFAVCNALEEAIPRADFALCREVLFHLSFADIERMTANIKRSARYLCATIDLNVCFNGDIRTGDFRMLNLMRSPFNWPLPVCMIPDNALSEFRYLAVWRVQ